MSSVAHRGYVHVGMDVSKDAIAVAVLPPDRDVAEVDKIFHDEESVRRLIKRLGRPSGLWACYEAGPTGYELHRSAHLHGRALRRGVAVAHPQGLGRPGQDRPARFPPPGRSAPRRVS